MLLLSQQKSWSRSQLRLGFGAALALCDSQGLVEQAQPVHLECISEHFGFKFSVLSEYKCQKNCVECFLKFGVHDSGILGPWYKHPSVIITE